MRVKGLLKIGEEVCRFEVADNRYAVKGEDDVKEAVEAVFIWKGIEANELRKLLISGFDEGKKYPYR